MKMAQLTTRGLVVMAAVAFAAGCASGPPTTAPTTAPAPTTSTTEDVALGAYADFWRVTSEALASPRSRDWTAELSVVATGQALSTAEKDVANYASLPAHVEGTVRRDPRVDTASASQVSIIDCVDLGDSRLVSDTTGKALDDLANRTVRYHYRADVVLSSSGKWLVDRTTPALDEPC